MPSNGTTGGAKVGADVFIVSAVRTPIGSKGGSLSSLRAPGLASIAIKEALDRIKLSPEVVEKVTVGQAVQAGNGQAPAKQALIGAGLPSTCRDCLVNEVCASGMQAIILSAIQIKYLGSNCLVAAGMESMSNAPHYLFTREIPAYGDIKVKEGVEVDGLTDTFNRCHMGVCAENTAKKYNISREDQDSYAIESYKRAREATEAGLLAREICSVEIPAQKNKPSIIVSEDEEFKKLNVQKIRLLNPSFDRTSAGTITAANASTYGDGAAACILMSSDALAKHDVRPLARIVSFGEGACDPIDFATSPVDAIKDALKKANLSKEDIAMWEINEAFSVVALANMRLLELDSTKVNVNGGGVSIGHPLGMSGIRIVNALVHQLEVGEYGCAAICRGGGGSAALIIQKL